MAILISLLIIGLIFAIIWWAITQVPVPEPFLTDGVGEFGGLRLGRFC